MNKALSLIVKYSTILQVISIILLGLLLFSPSMTSYFIDEDFQSIAGNRNILDTPKDFLRAFTEPGVYGLWSYPDPEPAYRPIYRLHQGLMYKISGLEPTIYHLFNVTIHVLVALLVYLLVMKIARESFVAYLSSVIYVSHYVFTNSVDFISGVSRIYGLMFGLISLLIYIQWREKKKSIKLLISSVIFYFISMLSVEEAVMIGPIIFIYELLFYPEDRFKPAKWIPILPFFIFSLIYMGVRNKVGVMLPSYGGESKQYNLDLDVISNFTYYIINLFIDVYRFLPWLENLKSELAEILTNIVIKWMLLITISSCLLLSFKIIVKRASARIKFFLFWIVLYLIPFLMLHHPSSAYLAGPSIGYSVLLSIGIFNVIEFANKKNAFLLKKAMYCLVVIFLGTNMYTTFKRSAKIAEKGKIVKQIMTDIMKLYPVFEDNAQIYLCNEIHIESYSFIGLSGVKTLGDNGAEFRLLYDNPTLYTKFSRYNYLKTVAANNKKGSGKYYFVFKKEGHIEEITNKG